MERKINDCDEEPLPLRYFDLHCDTLTVLSEYGSLRDGPAQVTLRDASVYSRYSQVFAVFTPPELEPRDGMERFRSVIRRFLPELRPSARFMPYLSVENAALIGDNPGNLGLLRDSGVMIITPVWSGESNIGGAYDTESGLTDFGKEAISEALHLGMIADASHSSVKTFYDLLELSEKNGKPLIASHSDSREVCDSARNLTDEQFRAIVQRGGLVGISLYRQHLSKSADCGISDILRHIEHYLSLGGEKTVCLGCDLDGIKELPDGLMSVRDIRLIADAMETCGFGRDQIDDVFYRNAAAFFGRFDLTPPGVL